MYKVAKILTCVYQYDVFENILYVLTYHRTPKAVVPLK